MLSVVLGLGGALIFGAADFLGGIASRRISAIRVTAVGGLAGLVVLALFFQVTGGVWSPQAVGLGAIAGVTGALAISLLYACLAIGPMSILSPLTAVVSAIVPLTAGVLRGEQLPPLGYGALALALVAIVLVGFVPDRKAVRPSLKALLMAVGAGTFIGAFLIIVDLTPDDSGVIPLMASRAVNASLLFATIGVLTLLAAGRRRRAAGADAGSVDSSDAGANADARIAGPSVANTGGAGAGVSDTGGATPGTGLTSTPGRSGGKWRPGIRLAIACGSLDATANVLVLIGLRGGDLSIIAVLVAMYPAGTILLAAVLLKERITPTQGLGLVLAITAAAMLALV